MSSIKLQVQGRQAYAYTGGKRFEHYLAVGPDGRFVRLIATAEAGQYDGLKPAIDKIASSIAFKAN